VVWLQNIVVAGVDDALECSGIPGMRLQVVELLATNFERRI
jgi:hypothetical protein